MESVYYYIADANPEAAILLLTSKYNYSISNNYTVDDIATALQDIVNTDGAKALKDVMDMHPDKMVILELYSTTPSSPSTTADSPTAAMPSVPSLPIYQNHDDRKPFFSSPTNVMIVGALVIGTIALLRSNNK